MEDPLGEICCNVEKWCKLVASLTTTQRLKFGSTTLHFMMQIPPIKMRTNLLSYMLEVFDSKSRKFIIEERVGEISVTGVDVECLMGLENEGLSALDILDEEGEGVKDRIPSHFLSKNTGNLNIDDLIAYIVKNQAAEDDFLRMVVLVLLGTVLVPSATKIIPKDMYALVEDVNRISKINWNAYMLGILMGQIQFARKGRLIRQWPKGNLALLQYLYWEKVQPQDDPSLTMGVSLRPLMRNWTEASACKRDAYDGDNGRGVGRGIVKIEDNITVQYRNEKLKISPTLSKQKGHSSKKQDRPASSKKIVPNKEALSEIMMKQLMEEMRDIRKQIQLIPEKVLALMNKTGVAYKPAADCESEADEDEEVNKFFQNGPVGQIAQREKKEFMYKQGSESVDEQEPNQNGTTFPDLGSGFARVKVEAPDVPNFMTPAKQNDKNGTKEPEEDGSPDNPFIIDEDKVPAIDEDTVHVSSSEVQADILRAALRKVPCKAKSSANKEAYGKRKTKRPTHLDSYMVQQPGKRQNRSIRKGLFANVNDIHDDSYTLSPELISAAVLYVETAAKNKDYAEKSVYKNVEEDTLAIHKIKVIIDHGWLSDDVIAAYTGDLSLRVGHDRHLCSVWTSAFLLLKDKEHGRNGAIRRVTEEYFLRDKAFFPVHISGNHWTTVVMHIPKQEFQVLDSLYDLSMTEKTIKALRTSIAADIVEANDHMNGDYPDVTNWPIVQILDMPKQTDLNSCGLFVLQCMEHWDGDKWTEIVNQKKVDDSRRLKLAQIVLSITNTLEDVKRTVVNISKKML